MVLICHRHDLVKQTFNELSLQPDPSSQVRLAGIRGTSHMDQSTLLASPQWQAANTVMQSLLSLQG